MQAFSVRQLLSSNALIYNPGNNIYFSKDALLRKTQFQFTAGLNFEINTGKTNSIFVGPLIYIQPFQSYKKYQYRQFSFY